DALRTAIRGGQAVGAAGKRGVAVYVEVRISGDQDEALLAHLVPLLDETELALRQAGYALYLQTGSALLGAQPLPEDPGEALRERKGALPLARTILEPLRGPGADPRIKLAVQVHAGPAQMRGDQITGGPLVDIESWAAGGDDPLRLTPAAAEGLEV